MKKRRKNYVNLLFHSYKYSVSDKEKKGITMMIIASFFFCIYGFFNKIYKRISVN
jgi:hypothetical protein